MKKSSRVFAFLFIVFCLISCENEQINTKNKSELAIRKNDAAGRLFQRYILLEEDRSLVKAALDSIDLAIHLDNQNPVFYYNKANFLSSIDSLEKAVGVLSELINLDSTQVEAMIIQGHLYRKMNKRNFAEESFLKALDNYNRKLVYETDNEVILGDRAFLYLFLYSKEEALSEIERLIKRYPDTEYFIDIKFDINNYDEKEFLERF